LTNYDHTDRAEELVTQLVQQADAEAKVAQADRQIGELRAKLAALPAPRSNPYRRDSDPSLEQLAELPQADYEELLELDPTLTERALKARDWDARQEELAGERAAQEAEQERLVLAAADPEAFVREEEIARLAQPRGLWHRLSPAARLERCEALGIDHDALAAARVRDWPAPDNATPTTA
jgi:hypothetical protein